MKLNVFILLFLLLVSCLRNHYHPKATKILLLFSSKSSVILAYIFRSLIYFNFYIYIYLFYEIGVQLPSFVYGYTVVPALFEKTIISPLAGLGLFIKNQ